MVFHRKGASVTSATDLTESFYVCEFNRCATVGHSGTDPPLCFADEISIPCRQCHTCCTVIFVQRKDEDLLGDAFIIFLLSEAEWITHVMIICKNSWLNKIWWDTGLPAVCNLCFRCHLHVLHTPISCRLADEVSGRKHSRLCQGVGVYLWMSLLQDFNAQIWGFEACVR